MSRGREGTPTASGAQRAHRCRRRQTVTRRGVEDDIPGAALAEALLGQNKKLDLAAGMGFEQEGTHLFAAPVVEYHQVVLDIGVGRQAFQAQAQNIKPLGKEADSGTARRLAPRPSRAAAHAHRERTWRGSRRDAWFRCRRLPRPQARWLCAAGVPGHHAVRAMPGDGTENSEDQMGKQIGTHMKQRSFPVRAAIAAASAGVAWRRPSASQ